MTTVREIPAGSGINGRPILEEMPGIRHIAFHRDGSWFTWCGRPVPKDHRCPSQEEIESRYPFVAMNCYECHARYRNLECKPWA